MMDAASRDGYGAALLDLSENDKIVVCKGTKTVNGAPQISVFCMNIDGEKITYVQHLTGPAY